jgi:hypothetical protein
MDENNDRETRRTVSVTAPSFPEAPENAPLVPRARERWQVLCGDSGHWRVGVYSPPESSAAEIDELELHDCPELFLLLDGELTLVLADRELRELPLEPGRPVLVTVPHCGYCPGGPHTGAALVVERDRFTTEYRPPRGWRTGSEGLPLR